MLVRFTDPVTSESTEVYVSPGVHPALNVPVLIGKDDRLYGSAEWLRDDGKVIHATPYERARFPSWVRFEGPNPPKPAQRSNSSRYVVYENQEFTITEQTRNGILVVTSSGISTPQNASWNTGSTLIVGNLRPGRLGMIVDLSELENWQDPAVHAAHMRGYPRRNLYGERHAFVCRDGVDPGIFEANITISGPLGYRPQYFTSLREAEDYLHHLAETTPCSHD
jgi:hypothetical protein